jgi:hypothetical protein
LHLIGEIFEDGARRDPLEREDGALCARVAVKIGKKAFQEFL